MRAPTVLPLISCLCATTLSATEKNKTRTRSKLRIFSCDNPFPRHGHARGFIKKAFWARTFAVRESHETKAASVAGHFVCCQPCIPRSIKSEGTQAAPGGTHDAKWGRNTQADLPEPGQIIQSPQSARSVSERALCGPSLPPVLSASKTAQHLA